MSARRQPAIGRSGPRRISRTLGPGAPERAPRRPPTPQPPEATSPAATASDRAARLWDAAYPAPADHPYLRRKQVGPNGLRCDSAGHLIVPLRDVEGVLHTIETITPEGEKRYLAGGAKAGHFCTIGGPLDGSGAFLICEGWATGASLHEATGLPVVAAMDAGNLGPVRGAAAQEISRTPRSPSSPTTTTSPDREINPGVTAATKAAMAIDARLAIPPVPGDANDLAILQGADAVAAMVAAAAFVQPPAPTYPEPVLTPEAARAELARALQAFMAEVPAYWRAVEEAARGRSVARHRPAGLQRAADRRAAAARPAGGRRARQVQLGARRDRDPAGIRSAGLPQGGLCRAAPRPRPEQVEAFRRSVCGRCSGRDARRPTPRRTIPSG